MEREQEIKKLVNVLRRTARMSMRPEWPEGTQEAAAFCTEQYNRVLARLKEIDTDLSAIFQPLQPGSSLVVAGMACRQLASYYEDEVGGAWTWRGECETGFDTDAVRDVWRRTARDIEDFGEFIRGSIDEWVRQRGKSPDEKKA
ncbi:MAG: hypothetical protein HY650_01250 [Acidobacteria bacterium]|nr:hypothetical protein [Acidobacteriota bacterium]